MRRRFRRILFGGSVLAGLAVAAGLGALVLTLPPSNHTLHLHGLHAPVTVLFDDKGVPHIRAANLPDADTALGYIHARDRMVQMELMRRLGSGRISEIAGPAGLPTDRMMRALGLRHLAEDSYRTLPPGMRAQLDAYASGVNAAIGDRGRFIAPEFLPFGPPAPWSGVDTLLWGRLMGVSLSGNWRPELDRLDASGRFDRARLLSLFAPHDRTKAPDQTALADTAHRLDALLPRFPAPFTLPDEESDEWAVDGRHSATGAPLLAGDPHLAFGFPALWYLARIDVPGLQLAGATAPGVPFIVIGQNGHIAWTFTSNSADTQDLFVETVLPDGRYATPDGPSAFAIRHEIIHVRGAPDVAFDVRISRHGPVISDALPGRGKGPVLALAAENLRPQDASPGLAALDTAQSVADAGTDAALIASPVQNLLVADRDTIGQFTTGHVPIRRSGDGAFPADGASGASDWTGEASGDALPHIVSPASGQILNANERTAPPDFPVYMGRDWPALWRADRIRALLSTAPRHDLAEFGRMQSDIKSTFAAATVPVLLARVPRADGIAGKARALLPGWTGDMHADAPQPLIFNAWIQRFVIDVETSAHIGSVSDSWEDMATLFLSPAGAAWCAGNCTPALARALDESTVALAGRFGDDPARWRWGAAHHVVFENALLRSIPLVKHLARADAPIGGDDTTLLRAGGALGDFDAVHGAAYRGLYNLADPDRSRFIVTPGQSGNWLSPDAWNLMRSWLDGSSMELRRQPDHVAARLLLLP
ncbi:penicillin acylase family protein [Acetobacteraceae bacterium KSS8]|uniref:Penicillin acylase family protein n=1 Tax=Endosaccharibacter trunci TaxID=2812733 RepID=A0ABT1W4E8_9PROT|nr:penicillin acylase family protein [Acetobacteraceae bacterium KSS8]